jgi:hypothetical protein
VSTLTITVQDSGTMLGRELKHADNPRLSALADRTARWMSSRYGRSEGTPRPAQGPAH